MYAKNDNELLAYLSMLDIVESFCKLGAAVRKVSIFGWASIIASLWIRF